MVISSASGGFYLAAIAWLIPPLEVAAVSLRAQAPVASALARGSVSPANVEDTEEDEDLWKLLDSSSAAATPVQQSLASAPQETPAPLALRHPEAVFQFAKSALDGSPPLKLPALPSKTAALSEVKAAVKESEPKMQWPPVDKSSATCDPPCIAGKGICSDKICFCRSPYSGSACHNTQTGLYRANGVMVVAFALVCIVLGILGSKVAFSIHQMAEKSMLQNGSSQWARRRYGHQCRRRR